MICNKCNHKLPEDSEFCQYCGSKIENYITTDKESVFIDETPDEALNTILKIQAEATVKAMEENHKTQPSNEDDSNFGLVPEKPIFTLALKSVDGEYEYLDKLLTANGEKIKYTRQGSMSVNGITGLVDIYHTFLPSGQPYKTIYINMYGAKASNKAPKGFAFKSAFKKLTPQNKKEKTIKIKYCSKCGNLIDNETKICTGCGKKYFKGIKINKFSVAIIVSIILIGTLSYFNICQYTNNQSLQQSISNLNRKVETKDTYIKQLQERLNEKESELDDEKWKNWDKLHFFDKYAACVNENSKKYHTYDCDDFDTSSFWIYNTNAAENKGYYACPKCH